MSPHRNHAPELEDVEVEVDELLAVLVPLLVPLEVLELVPVLVAVAVAVADDVEDSAQGVIMTTSRSLAEAVHPACAGMEREDRVESIGVGQGGSRHAGKRYLRRWRCLTKSWSWRHCWY